MAVDDREKLGILLNLSTELLLLIFESLPAPALLSISRVSRQLHYLALPVYFSRYNISNVELERGRLALEGDAMRALPGLQTSIALTSLDHLSCKFSGGNSYFTREVHRLCCLISKVEGVKAVTLDLGNIDSRWIDGLALINAKAWKEQFFCLLAGVVKKGCSHLVITHGHFLPVDSQEFLVDARKTRGLLRESVSLVTTFLKPPSPTLQRLLEAPYLNQLENISIHSGLFFINPFYEWFIQTISASPIHTLSFRLSGIPQKTWSSTLSRINIPSLSYFSAESVDISFVDLIKFLSRHPSIETLDLHPNFVYANPRNLGRRAKRPHLPGFHSLSGSPENVRDLLNILRPPLPHLHTIKLSLPTKQSVFRAVDFLKLENKISEAIQGAMPTELSLRFLVPYFVDDQSRVVKAGSSYERGFPRFPSVQTLKFVSDGHFAFVKWIIPKLPQWLATFPSLRHVMFSGDCAPSGSSGRTALVRSISFACNTVTLIVMDEEHHLVPSR